MSISYGTALDDQDRFISVTFYIREIEMKLKLFLRDLKNRYIPNESFRSLKAEMKKYPSVHQEGGVKLLCQVVEDITFVHRIVHFIFGYQIFKNQKVSLEWVIVRKNFRYKTLKKKMTVEILNNHLTDWKWYSIYKILGGRIALRYSTGTSEEAKVWASEKMSSIHSKIQLIDLQLEELVVGDLVYDTYLRFKPAATVDMQDVFLIELLEWLYDLYHRLNDYLENNKIEAVVTSYTSYIQHGVLARLALAKGVPVYSLGAINQLVVKPSIEFPFHTRNFHRYKEFFKSYDNLEIGRQKGRELIQSRLNGVIDQATSYMAKSSFHSHVQGRIFSGSARPRALVMGHDFYDSPHVYGNMVFADFYEWIIFVFEKAKESPYEFYYKPHPNGLPDNDALNEQLRRKFPHIKFLDKSTSNLQILSEGIDIAFSVYGTVAHEFAYMGVPVISAGVNPHESYSFNFCARSEAELESYILKIQKMIIDKAEIEDFCFVHNYRFTDDSLKLFPFYMDTKNITQYFSRETLPERIEAMVNNIQRADGL